MGVGGYFLVEKAKDTPTGDAHTALMASGIGVWVLDVIFMLLVCCMRKSLSLAITCLKQATKAIRDVKVRPLSLFDVCVCWLCDCRAVTVSVLPIQRVLLLPFAKFSILTLVMAWYAIVAVFIVSAGKFSPESLHVPGTDFSIQYKKVEWTESLRYSLLYHTFFSVWTIAFVMAAADVIISGVISRWYFTPSHNGQRSLDSPVSKSVAVIKKQGGSIAFGALVLTLIWFIKAALQYLHKRLKGSTVGGNPLVKFGMCCCMVRTRLVRLQRCIL